MLQWGRLRNTRRRAATRTPRSAAVSTRNIATRTGSERETPRTGIRPGTKRNENAPGPGKGADERAGAKVSGAAGSHE